MVTKKILLLTILMVSLIVQAQVLTPPAGGNKKAAVMERIGITDVQINYDRPAVKGREGKIWGNVVHYGFADLDYGTSKAAPWRAGRRRSGSFRRAALGSAPRCTRRCSSPPRSRRRDQTHPAPRRT